MAQGCYYLLRHGETAWSLSGQHTGRTDIPLTDDGRRRAADVAPMLSAVAFELVLCSPLSRARDTAVLAGLIPDDYPSDMLEWDYGIYEGRSTADIRLAESDPQWVIWDRPIPGGETPEDVAERCRVILRRSAHLIADGADVALVAHGHYLRIFTATYLGLPARDGRMFALAPGSVCVLGHERTQPVISGWNISPDGLG